MDLDSLTDNTAAVWCGFCVCQCRRHQPRLSAAFTAAGKLVISNLVYLICLVVGWAVLLVIIHTSSTVAAQQSPSPDPLTIDWQERLLWLSVLFIFNKITGVCKPLSWVCILPWLLRTLYPVTIYWRCISFHSRSLHCTVPSWPWKLIGFTIINDISILLILLTGVSGADASVEKTSSSKMELYIR